ncbi:MAG: DUF2478 domain-containing protein [Rhodocyclaceae bacterium]|nr:DUF2478 domain-containing protein [Rhodocyclaceae bacterium]MDZ4213199.1 DUF2478 domain-containing protein [Rhodocyclaceae bacterium]
MTPPIAAIAAIVSADRRAADVLVGEFSAALILAGHNVHGLIQQRTADDKTGTVLLDLHDGTRYPLFQNLGSGSASCSVDTGSLAMASHALRRALEAHADLAIANRFGPLEAEGEGLAAEMLAVMAEDIPFLTIVAAEYLPAWRHFTGGVGAELPAQRAALETWFAAAAATPKVRD